MGGVTQQLMPEMRSYVKEKADRFFKTRGDHGGLLTNVKSWVAEEFSGALGHGSMATLPDRPYLVWSFDYERPDDVAGVRSIRNNPVTYLAGCRALHGMLSRFDAEGYQAARELPIWQFYRAASLHRTYVLRDLLPKHGLIVD